MSLICYNGYVAVMRYTSVTLAALSGQAAQARLLSYFTGCNQKQTGLTGAPVAQASISSDRVPPGICRAFV